VKFSPVEEGLSGLALAPDIIVKVQVMPIPMPWINLYNATTYEHSYDSCNGSESWKSSLYLLNEKRVMAQSWERKKTSSLYKEMGRKSHDVNQWTFFMINVHT
jgi:hypothetical protein